LLIQVIHKKGNFAYEGHFTGNGAWAIPKRFKEVGFEIHLIFCGLNTVIRSIQRVDMRVKKGGFHVTPLAIENNYFGNMEMLNKNYSMFDSVDLLDTSNFNYTNCTARRGCACKCRSVNSNT